MDLKINEYVIIHIVRNAIERSTQVVENNGGGEGGWYVSLI